MATDILRDDFSESCSCLARQGPLLSFIAHAPPTPPPTNTWRERGQRTRDDVRGWGGRKRSDSHLTTSKVGRAKANLIQATHPVGRTKWTPSHDTISTFQLVKQHWLAWNKQYQYRQHRDRLEREITRPSNRLILVKDTRVHVVSALTKHQRPTLYSYTTALGITELTVAQVTARL